MHLPKIGGGGGRGRGPSKFSFLFVNIRKMPVTRKSKGEPWERT